MDKFEQHNVDRKEADKKRIENAKNWLLKVQNMYDGSDIAQKELDNAKDQLEKAYQESDFYNENMDDVQQTIDQQHRHGKR